MSDTLEHVVMDLETGETVRVPLTDAERAAITTPYVPEPEPDPNAALYAAIEAATTLAGLKAALLGTGKPARVAGRPVEPA